MKTLKISVCLIVTIFFSNYPIVFAQPIPAEPKTIDSLLHVLSSSPEDTNRVLDLVLIANILMFNNTQQALKYAQEGYTLAQKLGFKKGELMCMHNMGFIYAITGEWVKCTELCYKGILLSEKHEPIQALQFYGIMALMSEGKNESAKSLEWALKEKNHPLFFKSTNLRTTWGALMILGTEYERLNVLDSAYFYAKQSYDFAIKHNLGDVLSYPLAIVGRVEVKKGHLKEAIDYFQQAIVLDQQNNHLFSVSPVQFEISKVYDSMNQPDSAIYFATIALQGAKTFNNLTLIKDASTLLAKLFEKNNINKAYEYLKLSNDTKDSLVNTEKIKQLEALEVKEQQRLNDLKSTEVAYNNKIRQNTLFGVSGTLSLLLFLFWRNNRQKQKTNTLLKTQKEEIQSTLADLKSTQTQLIQKEKMASLGELTAGIAHEIQNPLNFVNNFSELSVDLAKELNEEIDKEAIDKELVKDLVSDLSSNQEKINLHGKRASNIVKGMLEHSRTSTGVKEPTDINKLVDESLRLSYHAMRAKDKSFNADFKTDFEGNLPKIEAILQDMGRVLLNLINNAFYAVNQRKQLSNDESYTPSVSVTTEQVGNQIIIKVKDNGTGMPESVRAKVFQPFFTTKPTGQGTGLGLSLAYDIVTKGHGGTLEVVSTEGVGSEFIIQLPI